MQSEIPRIKHALGQHKWIDTAVFILKALLCLSYPLLLELSVKHRLKKYNVVVVFFFFVFVFFFKENFKKCSSLHYHL